MHYRTREDWLLAAIELIRPLFKAKGYAVPPDCQVSCGFASTGTRSHHIGQCWSRSSSSHGRNQVFISPALGDAAEVLDTLVHELVHAVDDCQHKHGREFKKIALHIGLEGPMRSASAGKALQQQLADLARKLGPYPHGKLQVHHRKTVSVSRPRARCAHCGYTVPMLKRFLEVGPPLCPVHKNPMQQVGSWE